MIKALWAVISKTNAFKGFYSSHISRLETVEDIISFLVETYGASVVLIHHVEQKGTFLRDRDLTQQVYKAAKYPDKTKTITGFYSPEEFKGIIGQCDLYLTVRMHTSIAAMSQCIPTILVLNPKEHRRGVIRMLGQEKYLCNTFSSDELIPIIEDAWLNRDKIRSEMKSRIEEIKEASLRNAELVHKLMNAQ